MKTGILLHVYHLETIAWDELVWGRPESDQLGTATRLVECLLDIPASEEVCGIIYSGPSSKDGLIEGAYTKQFLLDRLDRLTEFPRLRERLAALPASERALLERRLHDVVVGPVIKNTLAEVRMAAAYFAEQQVDRVLEIAAATHAPRCMRDQAVLRHKGEIPLGQTWHLVASDVNYHGRTPDDIVIAEPMHRQDNPLYDYHPSWIEVTKRYSYLTLEHKKELLRIMDDATTKMLAEQPKDTQMAN